jgi:hypothetical protein
MKSRSLTIALLFAGLIFGAHLRAQSPSPTASPERNATDEQSPGKNLSPDGKWKYDCRESIKYECLAEVVNAATNEVAVDLDGDLNVYGKYSKRSNLVWAPDSKRFAFNFPGPAPHAFYESVAFYQLRSDNWVLLQSLAKTNPVSKAISRAIDARLAAERTKKHLKAKATSASDVVTKVHEWSDPDTVIIYAYEEDGEASGQTVRADFLFTVKIDDAGKFKLVKTQQLSEEESQKYQKDS